MAYSFDSVGRTEPRRTRPEALVVMDFSKSGSTCAYRVCMNYL